MALLEDRAVVAFKKVVEEKDPKGYASIDVNLMSLDVLKMKGYSAEYRKIDLKRLYGIRLHYFKKRRKFKTFQNISPQHPKG